MLEAEDGQVVVRRNECLAFTHLKDVGFHHEACKKVKYGNRILPVEPKITLPYAEGLYYVLELSRIATVSLSTSRTKAAVPVI